MLEAAADSRPADWVVEGIRGFAESVLSLVPTDFPAYGRVFHPGYRSETPVTWREIAAARGKLAHPAMQLNALVGRDMLGGQAGLYDVPPATGCLPPALRPLLARVLGRHTRRREHVYFAVWEGWGGLRGEVRAAPTFELPGRRYHLVTGPIDAISDSIEDGPWSRAASLWWPEDRSWLVATEVDLHSTYVGGSDACIADVVAAAGIEAARVPPEAGIDHASDTLNQ